MTEVERIKKMNAHMWALLDLGAQMELDNDGQIIIYSNLVSRHTADGDQLVDISETVEDD